MHMNSSSYFGVHVDVSTICLPSEDATPGIHIFSIIFKK